MTVWLCVSVCEQSSFSSAALCHLRKAACSWDAALALCQWTHAAAARAARAAAAATRDNKLLLVVRENRTLLSFHAVIIHHNHQLFKTSLNTAVKETSYYAFIYLTKTQQRLHNNAIVSSVTYNMCVGWSRLLLLSARRADKSMWTEQSLSSILMFSALRSLTH